MGITASLGFWQLDRAAQKTALQDAMRARAALPAWTQAELLSSPSCCPPRTRTRVSTAPFGFRAPGSRATACFSKTARWTGGWASSS
ncbi:MAG: hypothetical protein MUE35_11370 [Hydrogenophaga sp.]|nr:hypothetical protein [Hydrogenophaga sp.]